ARADAVLVAPRLRHALPPLRSAVAVLAADDGGDDHYHEDDHTDRDGNDCADGGFGALCERLHERFPKEPLLFFTSGTTGAPKGVVWSAHMLMYQLRTLSTAWHWSSHDRALNVLPLHHIHGLVNVVLSALYNGAALEMHSAFDAHSVWRSILGEAQLPPPTVFMAVPAVYYKLILYYRAASPRDQAAMRRAAAQLRLYVCGSAALSKAHFDEWHSISGHLILERYGMTETGMTLSNPYDTRRQGLLGLPLPGVHTAIENAHETGQLLIKGPGVFSRYYHMPENTHKAFTPDGWFKTGDVVTTDPDTGYFKLLGRQSADIINTGGYNVSALEIEEVIRECDGVEDCCVIGVPDDVLGQRIAAALILDRNKDVLHHVKTRVKHFLPKYKIPSQYHIVDHFPRNVMGKVQKQILQVKLRVTP
ncbi:unnamed protein product, partial [Agarophyton chilense]